MAPFKVIIVGGSVAGLALANVLEQYEIDFIVLEKHATLAPKIGAALGLLPNGLRILDQLGCYNEVRRLSQPLESLDSFDEHGNSIAKGPEIGKWMEELLGYKNENLDRQQTIEVLFRNLRNKSKVRTLCGVVKIHSLPHGVRVETVDGSVLKGDIVVGADGVHSQVFREMQRHADIDSPGSNPFDRDNIECTYRGLIGISKAPKGGVPGKLYFSCFLKNDQKTKGSSIPRYTADECDKLAATYENDIVKPGITFGDIYRNRLCSVLVPVHEGILKRCFYKRVVLVGDSWHTSNPLLGQGGNNAIVSAAYLANGLKSITAGDEKPEEARLQEIFREYQETRAPELDVATQTGHAMQEMDAFESPVMKFIHLHISPNMPPQFSWRFLSLLHSSKWTLRYLPLPSRQGLIPSRDEVKLEPRARSRFANNFWVMLFSLMVLTYYTLPMQASYKTTQPSMQISSWISPLTLNYGQAQKLYFHLCVTALTSLIAMESNRPAFSLGLLSSSLPFGIASLALGWHIVAPVYFCLFLLSTASGFFYYPSVRIIDPAMLNALRPAYLMLYGPTIIFTLTSASFPDRLWRVAHFVFPIAVYLLQRIASIQPTLDMVRKEQHVECLKRFIMFAYVFQQGTSLLPTRNFLWRLVALFRYGPASGISAEDAQVICLEVAIRVFIAFAYWDIRRVRGTSCTIVQALLYGVPISLCTSPATALLLFWGFRETEWRNACRRKSADQN